MITLAVKCAPIQTILDAVDKAGITGVEVYLSKKILDDYEHAASICGEYDFSYAVHAPNDDFNPKALARFVSTIGATVIVFHDIYWEDEWKKIIKSFKKVPTLVCIENVSSVINPAKFIRRYGAHRCLDLEHMQFEVIGVFEEEFINVIRDAKHIHLTGYYAGSKLWHSHIHHAPEHGRFMLDMIAASGYSGMVVSEARTVLQTYEEFRELNNFFNEWQRGRAQSAAMNK